MDRLNKTQDGFGLNGNFPHVSHAASRNNLPKLSYSDPGLSVFAENLCYETCPDTNNLNKFVSYHTYFSDHISVYGQNQRHIS